jgi:hypothetical protein
MYALAAAMVMGCGAKVAVDVLGSGQGGGGGGSATSGTANTTGETTGSGTSCMVTGCSGLSDSCDCTTQCSVEGNNQNLEVQCVSSTNGLSCTCIENGTKIAVCTGTGPVSSACDAVLGCCGNSFFGGMTTTSGGG